MTNREFRKKIASDTLQILEQGFFISPSGKRIDLSKIQAAAEAGTRVYQTQDLDSVIEKLLYKKPDCNTEIEVNSLTSLMATRKLIKEGHKDVLCLNFASARNPGGGFLGGSQAQEESIARATGLYNCQLKAPVYYEANRTIKSCIYTNHMIYSPSVPIIKDEEGNTLEELTSCGIITAPAVNTGIVRNREPEKAADIEQIMEHRIRKVLSIALANNHSALVLGAWGCGVFQNDPKDIATYFKEIIDGEFKNKFKKIVFAIYSRNKKFITPFHDHFG